MIEETNPVTKKLKELNLVRNIGNPSEEVIEKTKVESENPDSKWLIDKKFENTPEGVKELVKAYSNVQSQFDKKYNPLKKELDELKSRVKPLLALNQFINDNPEAPVALNKILEKKKNKDKGLEPPVKPDDFNVADIYEKGTSSHDYHQAELKHQRDMGVQESSARIDKLEQKLSKKDKDDKDFKALIADLKANGLEDDEIESYLKYAADPNIGTPENQILSFRAIRDKGKSVDKPPKKAEEKPDEKEIKTDEKIVESDDPTTKSKSKNKPVSAVAESGTADSAVDPVVVEKAKLWSGIMRHSNWKPEHAE